jgi:hypothetical protein
MPVLVEQSSYIDFFILDSNDTKSLIILDNSVYLDPPDKPLLQVILPGFTGYVSIPYNPKSYTILNSDNLDLTSSCDYDSLAELPDGVYQIKMQVCPTEEFYAKKCYLKTTAFYNKYREVLLNNDIFISTYEGNALKNNIIDTELLMQTAIGYSARCDIYNAIRFYTAADKKLSKIIKKLNCK